MEIVEKLEISAEAQRRRGNIVEIAEKLEISTEAQRILRDRGHNWRSAQRRRGYYEIVEKLEKLEISAEVQRILRDREQNWRSAQKRGGYCGDRGETGDQRRGAEDMVEIVEKMKRNEFFKMGQTR